MNQMNGMVQLVVKQTIKTLKNKENLYKKFSFFIK